MKLTDIVQEADQTLPADKQVELKELVKYFPNTYKKAVNTLAKAGRLTFGGEVVVKDGDHGPALERAIAEAEEYLKADDFSIEVDVEMDGSVADIDDGGMLSYEATDNDYEFTYSGYSMRGDRLIIGFDAWLNEEEFSEKWDPQFEKVFGEDFDMDNPAHEKIFNHARKAYMTRSFLGVVVEVDDKFNVVDTLPLADGFHKGVDRKRLGLVDFDVS